MLYPINLELNQFNIVIIGGGEIAYRKCKNFIQFNKEVKVVAPHFLESFYHLEGVCLIKDYYDEKYIENGHIIVAATNDVDVNENIATYCHQHGKLVNVVTSLDLSNYTVPSYIKRGDLLLSVSTGGKSPALAKKIKSELEEKYDDSYAEYLNLLGTARTKIMETYADVKIRRELIRELISMDLEELRKISLSSN